MVLLYFYLFIISLGPTFKSLLCFTCWTFHFISSTLHAQPLKRQFQPKSLVYFCRKVRQMLFLRLLYSTEVPLNCCKALCPINFPSHPSIISFLGSIWPVEVMSLVCSAWATIERKFPHPNFRYFGHLSVGKPWCFISWEWLVLSINRWQALCVLLYRAF